MPYDDQGVTVGRPRIEADATVPARRRMVANALIAILNEAQVENQQVIAHANLPIRRTTFSRHLRGDGSDQPSELIVDAVVRTVVDLRGVDVADLRARYPVLRDYDTPLTASGESSSPGLDFDLWVPHRRARSFHEGADRLLVLLANGQEHVAVGTARTLFEGDDAALAAALAMIADLDIGAVLAFVTAIGEIHGRVRRGELLAALDHHRPDIQREIVANMGGAYETILRAGQRQAIDLTSEELIGHRLAAFICRGDLERAQAEFLAYASPADGEVLNTRGPAIIGSIIRSAPDGKQLGDRLLRTLFIENSWATEPIVTTLFDTVDGSLTFDECIGHLNPVTFGVITDVLTSAASRSVNVNHARIRRLVANACVPQIARVLLNLGQRGAAGNLCYLAQFVDLCERGEEFPGGNAGAVLRTLVAEADGVSGVVKVLEIVFSMEYDPSDYVINAADMWDVVVRGVRRALCSDFHLVGPAIIAFLSTHPRHGADLLRYLLMEWDLEEPCRRVDRSDLVMIGAMLDCEGTEFAVPVSSALHMSAHDLRLSLLTSLDRCCPDFTTQVLAVAAVGFPETLIDVLSSLFDHDENSAIHVIERLSDRIGSEAWRSVSNRFVAGDVENVRIAIHEAMSKGGQRTA
ncbi:hypothetical protein [Nocardia vinacea]|uniref:hypothetical protein n=1 Tax=Nocardia vinacea TaxID=96468 RepID=UPI0002E0FCE2|nr:hypothetical protein [Nocardia vinacea]